MNYHQQFSSVVSRPDGYGLYKNEYGVEGSVATEWGFVKAWSDAERSSVSIIIDGCRYTRTFKRAYTKRGLVTKAVEFAREVAEGGV